VCDTSRASLCAISSGYLFALPVGEKDDYGSWLNPIGGAR
jgi:hypothetical protein